MKHHRKAMALLISIALSATAAEDTMAPASATSPDAKAQGSKVWAQTNLQAEPALREQIDQTKTFLDDKESEVDGQVSRLKTEGLIDRRSTTKIRSALDDARGSMTGMAEGMQSDQQLDGWSARMIAYELGMAADTLAQQAEKIETELVATAGSPTDPGIANSAKRDQRRDLIATLRETSTLLHKAARAIAGNVQ